MMMSQRERWIGIVAGVVVGLLLLDQVVLSPLLARLSEASERVDQHQRELAQADQLFQNRLRAQRKWRDMAGVALLRDAPGAESQVLNRVREWAATNGLTLTSLKPERSEKEREFHRITIRATATGTMAQTAGFLHAVQTSGIPIRVADIQIASRREGIDDLSLQMGLATIYMPDEPARAAGGAR